VAKAAAKRTAKGVIRKWAGADASGGSLLGSSTPSSAENLTGASGSSTPIAGPSSPDGKAV
jgi:hypothetical protein